MIQARAITAMMPVSRVERKALPGLHWLIGVALMLLAAPAFAQDPGGEVAPEVLPTGINGICMSRQITGPAGSVTQKAIVPATSVGAMVKIGFSPGPCNAVFSDQAAQRAFRDEACDFVATREEWMQREYEKHVGVRAAIICGMAQLGVGEWDTGNARRAR